MGVDTFGDLPFPRFPGFGLVRFEVTNGRESRQPSLRIRRDFERSLAIRLRFLTLNRFQGELYTGLHQEPSFGGVGAGFMRRFAEGRRFIVRVKPGEPEVSVMREGDQADSLINTLGN